MLSLKVKSGWAIAGAAFALGVASPANAAAILGLYDTGVDATNNVVAPGQVDQHYTITASTKPGFVTPAPAFTAQSTSWSANDPVGSSGSGWITANLGPDGVSAGKSGTLGQNGGLGYTFDYTLNFSLGTLSAASAMITGQVQSDNFVRVLLNGIDIGGQTPIPSPGTTSYFRTFTAFGTSAGFQNGANTLTFQVTDYGVISGLRVDNLMGTAVPEPGVWAMLIVGFGLVASQIRRRRRQGPLAIA
jgi:hypothetical protein